MKQDDNNRLPITKETTISIGFGVVLLVGAISYGALTARVDAAERSIEGYREVLERIDATTQQTNVTAEVTKHGVDTLKAEVERLKEKEG